MYITEQYYMYQLANRLIKEDHYEILHMNTKTEEIWLEKYEHRSTKIVRLTRKGFDWKNHLRIDISSVFQRIKSMKRFFIGKDIEIYNVYVTDFEPVDDWRDLKHPMVLKEKKPVKMKVFYMTEENLFEEQDRLFNQLDTPLTRDIQFPSEQEQENDVVQYQKALSHMLHQKNKEMQNVFTYGKPRFTKLLIVINLVMFFMLELSGGSMDINNLIANGAKYNPAILNGEWWRIVSSMFLHIGFLHLFMNMVALYYLGMAVERMYGSVRFLIIYFLAGIGGGLTSFAFNINVAAGASGALFGLFGALLFFGVLYKRLFFQTMGKGLLLILAINLVFGFMIPQIDMGAHVGGLLMGFLASCITYLPRKKNIPIQLLAGCIYIVITVLLIFYGLKVNLMVFG